MTDNAPRSRDAVLARVLAMSRADQLAILIAIANALAATPVAVPRRPEINVAVLQAQAVDDMRKVADHLGLGPNKAPTREQYDNTRTEAGASLSSSTIIRAFQRWKYATIVASGTEAATSVVNHQMRHGRSNVKRPKDQIVLDDVRLFLQEKDEATLPTVPAYNDWVKQRAAATEAAASRAAGTKPAADTLKAKPRTGTSPAPGATPARPPRTHASVINHLRADWRLIIAAARDEVTIEEARQRTIAAIETDTFVSAERAAWLLGRTSSDLRKVRNDSAFPQSACTIGTWKMWAVNDLLAFRDGTAPPNPGAREGYLNDEVVDTAELLTILDITRNELRIEIEAHRVYADGIAGGNRWWWRKNVDAVLTRPPLSAQVRPKARPRPWDDDTPE